MKLATRQEHSSLINKICGKYNGVFIGKLGLEEYLKEKGRGDNPKLITRGRCGNLKESKKFWLSEDRKLCDLCLLD